MEIFLSFFSDWDLFTNLDFNLDKLVFAVALSLLLADAATQDVVVVEVTAVLTSRAFSGDAIGAATAFLGLVAPSEPESVSSI